jgi:hypothetical protein
VTVRFVLYVGSNDNVLAEMHDMKTLPVNGDYVLIDKEQYQVIQRSWDLVPRDPDKGAYRDGYPEVCSVTVYVRRW